MRLLISILLTGLLLTGSGISGHSTYSLLPQNSLASLQSPANSQLIVRGRRPSHRGSGRLESYQGIERSLG